VLSGRKILHDRCNPQIDSPCLTALQCLMDGMPAEHAV
jgi:hypothetical protein